MKRKQLFHLLTCALAALALSCGGKALQPPTTQPAQAAPAAPPTITVTTVQSHELNRQTRLPGELQAYQDVVLYAKVQGFVQTINVDRGSIVRQGQLLATLRAPEIDTQRSEAEARARAAQSQRAEAVARISSIKAQRLEAEAKLAAEETTYQRLKAASATPGAVAGNDVDIAQRNVEGAKARVQLYLENEKAAQSQVRALEESEKALLDAVRGVKNVEDYLKITAPFDGVITERNAHLGSLVGSANSVGGLPMLRLQQIARLRLVVAVPETEVAGVTPGKEINFTVPAFPGETFTGRVLRVSHALDAKTRTMPVELEVGNARGRLAPGMFSEVTWPTRRPRPSLFVPPGAVATTTERSFVIRINGGVTEWVDVKRGASMNQQGVDLVEVFGELAAGEQIAARGTDELRAGTKVNVKIQGGK
ncbi:MAG: efflux RND transporter periplasmic adaptor subunit [Acidobacteria bacterium]|nr:efflux RND transporter periplasmic adaptor subunit [Acidobacteriota bacterium]MBI3423876.1 efflux RND transporter periplasmic adaptor subunit [Acidobacteriota bacterium]